MSEINKITRADIDVLCRPGDVIAVEYLKKDLTANAISFLEEGSATHALCCMGGLDVVEACITGVTESNLHNYLRGNTRLTVRSTKPAPSLEESEKATDFWSARVNDPYDIGMIFGSIPILLAKNFLGFFSKSAGEWAFQKMPNLLGKSNLSTCAELGVRGIREFCPTVFTGYSPENINPEMLRTHPSLDTKAILDGAVLID